jgi:hypothetical protein
MRGRFAPRQAWWSPLAETSPGDGGARASAPRRQSPPGASASAFGASIAPDV